VQNSKRIAGLVGPTIVAMIVSEFPLVQPHLYDKQIPPVVYLSGTLMFVAGLAIVRAHNHWARNWAVLVTLAGWFSLFLGLFRMFAAGLYQRGSASTSTTVFMVLEGILLVFGLIMTFKAYSRDSYAMTETSSHSHFAPEGWHTVTPRIVAHHAERLVEFLRQVFGATGDYRRDRPSEIRIGDSIVMISDAEARDPMPAFLYVYVEDADDTYRRALQAGATALEEPSDMPYGDRRGMVKDEWGNTWQIATRAPRP